MHRRIFIIGTSGIALLVSMMSFLLASGVWAEKSANSTAGPSEVRFDHSTVRLLDGGWLDEDTRLAGIEIALKKGWKTYWKVPGDSGLPPTFNFAGSKNIKAVRILWPVPKRFRDPELGETIGYKHSVIFPVRLLPVDPGKPILLSVEMTYALCSDICIPAEVHLVKLLKTRPDTDDHALSRVRKAYSQVPDADKSAGPEIIEAYIRKGNTRPELVLTLRGAELDANTDIFVEGPDVASFCHPRFLGREGVKVRYFLPVDGLDSADGLAGAKLVLTIVSKSGAWERTITLPQH